MTPERWQQIEQLYHSAIERDVHQRAAFLEEACAGDDALRQELDRLLAANEHASGILDGNALEIEAFESVFENKTLPQSIGRYQLLSSLGAGGMGEVHLAVDRELGRKVALKMLPARFTQYQDRLQRFIREARAASSLNHPNIVTIYEIGKADQAHFIAMEHVEGATLRRRIMAGVIPLREALDVARQICAALDVAHKAGIVHRDIKPENVMVRPDGLVKVLDFGLAKLTIAQDSGGGTLVELSTETGLVMGTPRYMSPEQARGQAVDGRTDIFSLGVVLYEMVAGRMPFSGTSTADWLVALLEREPAPISEFVPEISPELDRIIRRALCKKREERYQDCSELLADLKRLPEDSDLPARLVRVTGEAKANRVTGAASVPQDSPAPARRRRSLVWAAPAIAALLLVLTWWYVAGRRNSPGAPVAGSLKSMPVASWRGAPGEGYSVGAFSPDGKKIAFASNKNGSGAIWVKQTASNEAVPVTRDSFTNDCPIWSPDGEEIAYTSLREEQFGIWRIPYLGGTPVLVAPLADREARLRSWSRDGATIYYESRKNLYALNLKSQATIPLLQFDTSRLYASSSIAISRDERQIAYVTFESDGQNCLWVISMRGGSAVKIASHPNLSKNPVWLPDNQRILYSSDVEGVFQLFVAHIDGRPPAQLTEGGESKFALDVSAEGTRILYGGTREESDIWQVRIDGSEEKALTSDMEAELWPAVSPDGKTLAFQFVKNLNQGDVSTGGSILGKPVEAEGAAPLVIPRGFLPVWSPDGKEIAFLREANADISLYTIKATGGPERQLVSGGVSMIANSVLPNNLLEESHISWAPDGKSILYPSARDGFMNFRRVLIGGGEEAITDHREPNQFLSCPLWNRDGSRIAYASRAKKEGGWSYKIWVVDPATRASRMLIESGSYLRLLGWSATGRELLLVTNQEPNYTAAPSTVNLVSLTLDSGAQRKVALLPAAYLDNIHLSVNKEMIAFVSRSQGKDDILTLPASGGSARRITANSDSRLYFSSLEWSPDGRAIYFGKHSRHSLLSMIVNFN